MDCDNDVDLDDFDDLMRYLAELYDGVVDLPGCLDIGEVENNFSHLPWGDLNCDGEVNALDALFLIAYEADVILQQEQGCFNIGENMI
jgi:hypothetical protein